MRTLEKFRFLGLHRDCDARSEVGAYNKRVSIRRLGRSGGMLPRENFEIWVPQISGNAGRSYTNEMFL